MNEEDFAAFAAQTLREIARLTEMAEASTARMQATLAEARDLRRQVATMTQRVDAALVTLQGAPGHD